MPTVNDASGTPQKVDSEGRALNRCVIETIERHTNQWEGEAYSVTFNQSPTAADDPFFYMVNSNTTDLVVEGITLGFINATAVDAEVYVELGATGTRDTVTALTPTNLNGGSGNVAQGTFEQGAELDGGAATLAGGAEVERWVFADVQNLTSTHYNFPQDVILPKNKTLTMLSTDAGATYYVTVYFHYHDQD